jgi:hypothetical protein
MVFALNCHTLRPGQASVEDGDEVYNLALDPLMPRDPTVGLKTQEKLDTTLEPATIIA